MAKRILVTDAAGRTGASAGARLCRWQWKTLRAFSVHCLPIRSPTSTRVALTGPQSQDMHFYAQEHLNALGRTITYQDKPPVFRKSACRTALSPRMRRRINSSCTVMLSSFAMLKRECIEWINYQF